MEMILQIKVLASVKFVTEEDTQKGEKPLKAFILKQLNKALVTTAGKKQKSTQSHCLYK